MTNGLSEEGEQPKLSRREFLKLAGAAGLTLLGAGGIACSRRRGDAEPSIKPTEIPPTPTPILEALKIKEFSLETVDFTFDDNIGFGDRLEIRSLFESAYPLLTDIFGIEPQVMPGKEKLKLHLVSGEWQGEQKFQVNGHLSGFNKEGERTMYLRSPREKLTNLHEFSHLFTNFPSEYDYDLIQEGFAVAAEIIIGQKLGLIDSEEGIILKYLGELYDPESFNDEIVLPAFSYDGYPPMMAIRYITAGLAWSKMYKEDPEVFKKFHQLLGKALKRQGGSISVDDLINEAFTGNFEKLRQEHPILSPLKIGKKVAFAPVDKGRQLIACCYEFDRESQKDLPLEGISLELTLDIDGETIVNKGSLDSTDNSGITPLFMTPQHPNYIGRRIPDNEKTSLMKLTVEGLVGKQELSLNIFPVDLSTSYLLRPSQQMTA